MSIISKSFSTQTVDVTVKNIENKDAGAHLTYVETNDVGASDVAKPKLQSQFSVNVSVITAVFHSVLSLMILRVVRARH